MKKLLLLPVYCSLCIGCFCQNLGINHSTPQYPISLPPVLGDKVSLYGDAGPHYGFGIQPYLMQIHTDGSGSDIAFGYGSSQSFSEIMRIKGNGNIGIGTNSPNAPLGFPALLGKKITLYPGTIGDAGLAVWGNELRIASDYYGADITFGTDDRANGFTERMRIKGNGNVAIGTDNPFTKLHVNNGSVLFSQVKPYSNLYSSVMYWDANNGSFKAGTFYDNIGTPISFGSHSAAFGDQTISSGDGSVAAGSRTLAIGRDSYAMGTQTVASGNGSVAMGSFSRAEGEVSLSFGFSATTMGYTSASIGRYTLALGTSSVALGAYSIARAYGSCSVGTANDDTDTPNPATPSSQDRVFQVGNGTVSTYPNPQRKNALTILRNGNTGIGRINPDFPLSFSDSLGTKISFYGSANYHYGIGIQGFRLQLYTPDVNGNIIFGYGSSTSLNETMRIQGNGNVGIGTATPGQKLQVAGNICASGTISSCSDIRYKKDFTPIFNSLSSVLSLNGFYYHWKQDEFPDMQFSDKRQLGFSAQEVEKLFPELVMTGTDGYKSVDYGRLTPVLVEAIKEQQQQIELLKKDHLQQEQRINDMEKEIAELKTMLKKSLNQ